ncbi:MAG: heparan-alpha-glucosaminide N-acetyltransferase domain-containing protein [Terriglobales bacterium]
MAPPSHALASPASQGQVRSVSDSHPQTSRIASVDILRGAVMVIMALDHTRHFFTGFNFEPEDLAHTSGSLFFARWITHFCSPVFFLLAGTGAYLAVSHGKPLAEVSRFLWTRGLWLIFLEATVVGYSWTFVFPFVHGGVIWALGWSMIAMAVIVRLPIPWIGGLGAGMILTHNLFDRVPPAAFGKLSWIWSILHCPGSIRIGSGGGGFLVAFPLIPWVGVMATGYALGAMLQRQDRRKLLFLIGATLSLAFFSLRIFNLYGNGAREVQAVLTDSSGPWSIQPTWALTLVSFFNTQKFPPSLQFLLMTLGPSLMALAWFDGVKTRRGIAGVLLVFGRVPLFYYVLHLFFIHTLAVWVALVMHQPAAWLLYGGFMLSPFIPPGYGHGLLFTYAMWLITVVLLYFPCKLFMNFKQQHPGSWWLSYL